MVLFQLDLDKPLEQQGPFDVIIHKLTDQISRSQSGCREAQQNIDRFQVVTAVLCSNYVCNLAHRCKVNET